MTAGPANKAGVTQKGQRAALQSWASPPLQVCPPGQNKQVSGFQDAEKGRMGVLCALLERMAVKGNSVTAWALTCANGALTCAA